MIGVGKVVDIKKFNKIFTTKRIMFLLAFFILVLIGKNINFSAVIGVDNQFFTLYQFFGPIAGAILGPVFGVIAVGLAQIADFLILGKQLGLINILRLTPMLFAAFYFGYKKKYLGAIVPVICMGLFIAHPVGRDAWLYSMYWLIPILGAVLPRKVPGRLFFQSLGATFTAHAVGSVLWLYSVPMEAGAWMGLIPIVAWERFLFGMGIVGSYLVFNTALDYIDTKFKLNLPSRVLFLDKKYNLVNLFKTVKVKLTKN